MKASLLLGAIASPNVAALPQAGGLGAMASISLGFFQAVTDTAKKAPTAPFQIVKAKPDIFPAATREKVVYGPFTLQPSNGQHEKTPLKLDAQSDAIERKVSAVCKNCMVLKMKGEFTDKTGTRLGLDKKIYVHHIILANHARSMATAPMKVVNSSCSAPASAPMGGMMGPVGRGNGLLKRQANPAPSLILAKGNEEDATIFAPVNSTIKSGYWIAKDDPLLLMTEVVNYQKQPQEVYLTLDVEYLSFPEGKPSDYLDVRWGIFQVACGPGGLALRPPKDKPVTFEAPTYQFSADGYLVGTCNHDGGLNMKILVNGEVACKADAIYGGDGGTTVNGQKWETITSYSPCLGAIPVKKNDRVQMISEYDLTKHQLRPDSVEHGMEAEAMAIGFFQYAVAK